MHFKPLQGFTFLWLYALGVVIVEKTFTIGPHILFNFQHTNEVGTVINIPVLQMRELMPRQFK